MKVYRQPDNRQRPLASRDRQLTKIPAWLEHARWFWLKGPPSVLRLEALIAFLSLVTCAGLITSGTSCTQVGVQAQAQTADTVAAAANAGLPILVERYRQEGFEVITAVKQRGGTAQEAREELQAVKDKWAPVWEAWKGLRIAQDAWADALESGGSTVSAALAMKEAYCKLLAAWPESVPAVPIAPLKCQGAP